MTVLGQHRSPVRAAGMSEALATAAGDPTCRMDWKKFDTGGVLIASGDDRLQQC
jgi:hypothetical protein